MKRPMSWPIRRGMLLGGVLALAATAVGLLLPVWLGFILAAIGIITALVACFLRMSWRSVLLFCGLWLTLFLSLTLCRRVFIMQPVLVQAGKQDTLTLQVTGVSANNRLYTARVVRSGCLPAGTSLRLYCPDAAAPELYDEVTTVADLRPLGKESLYDRAHGIYLIAFPTAAGEEAVTLLRQNTARPWQDWLSPLRQHLADSVMRCLPDEEGALLTAICLGERSCLSDAIEADFRTTGLSHLLAVSGLHLTFISGGVLWLLRRLRLRTDIAAGITMVFVGLFGWLVGFSPSVTRACIMCWVLLSGRLFRYPADSRNSLGFSLVLLLALDSNTLFDMGFWLSFGATAGLLCLVPPLQQMLLPAPLEKEHRMLPRLLRSACRGMMNSLLITLGATLPLLPLLACVFGEISLVSPLYNLLTVMPSMVLLFMGCVAMLLCALPGLSAIGQWLLIPIGWLTRGLQWLIDLPADMAVGRVQRLWAFVWLFLACALSIWCIFRQNRRLLWRCSVFFTATFLLLWGLDMTLGRQTVTVQLSAGDKAVTALVEQGPHAVLLVPRGEDAVHALSAVERSRPPDAVVLFGGEPVHAVDILAAGNDQTRYYTLGEATWTAGLGMETTPLATETPLFLWEGCTLLVTADGCWRLAIDGAELTLAPTLDQCPADTTACFPSGSVGYWHIRWPNGDVAEMTNTRLVLTSGKDWSVTRWQ